MLFFPDGHQPVIPPTADQSAPVSLSTPPFLGFIPYKGLTPLCQAVDYFVFPKQALSFPVSASLLLRHPLPSSSIPVEILPLVQLLNPHGTFFVLLGFIVCFILQPCMYLVGSPFKFSIPWGWRLAVTLHIFLPTPVSTLPAPNRSPINVSWIGPNILLAVTPLCQSHSWLWAELNKLLPTHCDPCRLRRTINNATEEAHDYICSFVATASQCWFIWSFQSHELLSSSVTPHPAMAQLPFESKSRNVNVPLLNFIMLLSIQCCSILKSFWIVIMGICGRSHFGGEGVCHLKTQCRCLLGL